MLFFFPRGVLDEILNLIESVSEGFPSYFFIRIREMSGNLNFFRDCELSENYKICQGTGNFVKMPGKCQ